MLKFIILILLTVLFSGCTAYKPVSQKPDKNKNGNIDFNNKRSAGIDFFASGNEPSWKIDLDSEDSTKIYLFPNIYSVSYKTPAPILDSSFKTIKYTFDTDVTLTLINGMCTDNMSGEILNFIVSLNISNNTYKGCGKYIIAPNNPLLSPSTLLLNDIWALKKFKNQNVDAKSFKNGIPILELHLNDGKFLLYTNCSSITGNIDVGNSHISFYDIISSDKICDDDFELYNLLDLKSFNSWSFDKMVLTLKQNGKEVLVFNKID